MRSQESKQGQVVTASSSKMKRFAQNISAATGANQSTTLHQKFSEFLQKSNSTLCLTKLIFSSYKLKNLFLSVDDNSATFKVLLVETSLSHLIASVLS